MNEAEFTSPLPNEELLFFRMKLREELGRLPEVRLDLVRNSLRLGAVTARVHQDGGTTFRQCQRDRAADIAACAGDNGDLADEFFGHEPLPTQ